MIRIYADLNCPFCYALSEWIDEAELNSQIEWRLIEHNPSASFQSHSDQALAELTEEIFIIRQRASDIQIHLPMGRPNVRKAEKLLNQVKLSYPELFIPLKKNIYRAYWAEDGDIEDDQVLHQQLKKVGLNPEDVSVQNNELISRWTREWEEGPFERRLPVIQRSDSDFSLGLASKDDTLRYLKGQSGGTSDTNDSCQYQLRPQIAMLGGWPGFWNLTKVLRDHNDLIFHSDIEALTKRFESVNPPELVLINYVETHQADIHVLEAFSHLCEQYQCPLLLFIERLSETQELNLLQMGCSDVISQKSEQYALLKINKLLKNKAIFNQLTKHSLVDSLTQLNNRRSFISALEKEWAGAARTKRCLSLLILDIDYFKAYNDHFGHLAGDGCLRQVANLIQGQIQRKGDVGYRYGGEEFAVILPNTETKGAQKITNNILVSIRQAQLDHPASEHKCVTVSIGICSCYYQTDVSTNDLIESADQQLYRAKLAGRNTYRCL